MSERERVYECGREGRREGRSDVCMSCVLVSTHTLTCLVLASPI